MERNGAATPRNKAVPMPAAGDAGALPAELRFLAAQATDAQERERIVRAYYTFAHGTPESSTVQFALLAGALLRANLSAAQDLTEQAAKLKTLLASAAADARARPPATAQEVAAAVQEALGGLAQGLNVLNREIMSSAQQRLTGAALLMVGLLLGTLIGYALGRF